MHEIVYVFGNEDLPEDALPIQCIPDLQKTFPDTTFTILDPNESWELPKHVLILDTVVNIEKPQVFTSLEAFTNTPRLTCHSFDAHAELSLMKKIGHVEQVTIIGIPPTGDKKTILKGTKKLLRTHLHKKGSL